MTEITIEKLSFGYGTSKKMVLNDVNLHIDRPGLYSIIGPNGVGKSTLIKCINKILKPSGGRVCIDGKDVNGLSNKDVSKLIGYVPVSGTDMFSMPVIDAILVGRFTQQKWKTTSEDLQIVNRTMELLGITSLAMHGYNELSAGQHQKVAIARGLVQEAPILLLDEPTANLDVRFQVYIAELLQKLARATGMTILMISHDLNIAAKYSDQIILMGPPGTIRMVGPPEQVISKEVLEEIYGVECELVHDSNGKPHIILGTALRIDD